MSVFRWRPLHIALARCSTMALPREATSKKLPLSTRNAPDLLLHKYLLNNEKIDQDKWPKIREEMLSSRLINITKVNIDAVIMDTCCALDHSDTAMDYCLYLKSQDSKFNLATTARYFKLLTEGDAPLTEEEEEDVIKTYDALRKDYKMLDGFTTEACIRGLSRTNRWRDAHELLKTMQETDKPSPVCFRSIIYAAFKNNEPDIAWDLMDRKRSSLNLDGMVYRSFLEHCTKVSKSNEELQGHLERMFEAFSHMDVYPKLNVMEDFGKVTERLGWTAQQCSIRTSAACSSCGHTLSQLNVDEDAFHHLRKNFQAKVLVGRDVWDKTTPQELSDFKRFVEASRPYDVVIDGLNVEYSLSNHNRKVTGEKLAHVVRMFVDQGKKVMVLGRKHMMRWKKEHVQFIQNNSRFFVANDTSEDDPYLLFAALSGGVNTYIVSKDLMRQHKYVLLDSELQKTFKLWLLTRRIQHTMAGHVKNKVVFLIYPPSYLPTAQKDDNGWHIPAMENDLLVQPSSYDSAQPWYCFRKKKGGVEANGRLNDCVKR